MKAPALTRGPAGTPRLGAHPIDGGVRFAVTSRHAERVELCLFDAEGRRETARLSLPERDGDVWHGFLPDAAPGLFYGYRVHGPYAPDQGHRFNPHKLLVDPYATALGGRLVWHGAVHGYRDGQTDDPRFPDVRDSAPYVPRSRVSAWTPPPSRPPRPRIPWADTVLYELHARGFSMRHPDVPAPLRGKLEALALPTLIEHFHRLGVTTLELLPLAAFLDELHLVRRGLRNYWGYNPVAPLAIHAPYLASAEPAAFASVIDRLHEAGLEVVLDVVYNHTAEGDARGPTLSLRGLDNTLYYRLDPAQPQRYVDYSGCGNTPDISQPAVLDWVLTSLRHWAELGVDGFRLDLASALMRDREGRFDAHAPLMQAIDADPLLRTLKWIAEPWDLGHDGHALGRFPAPVAQWNDRFRDSARRFWRGDPGTVGDWATRLAGSSDVFAMAYSPLAGVNLVTAHDGFTLADLTAYEHKHNLANGEHNRDGHEPNWSSNGGIEGDTDDTVINAHRRQRRRALLGSLLLARGVPMLLAGDELSHSQAGNNNAYCQDNPVTWLDWTARDDPRRDLRAFVAQALKLRRSIDTLRGDHFYEGKPDEHGVRDLVWLREDGNEYSGQDWDRQDSAALVALIAHRPRKDAAQSWILIAMQPGHETRPWTLPILPGVDDWICVLDSLSDNVAEAPSMHAPGEVVSLPSGALRVLVPQDAEELGVPRDLSRRAHAAGVEDRYTDVEGTRRQVPAHGLHAVLAALAPLRPRAAAPTVSKPPSCWVPEALHGAPGRWVLAVQVYALRGARDWGIGDFDGLRELVRVAAAAGASGLMLSPLHAPMLDQPERASPYAPSNRLALNPLMISIPAAAEAGPTPGYLQWLERADVRAMLRQVSEAELIDYTAVARLKLAGLARLFDDFRRHELNGTPTPRGTAFLHFRRKLDATDKDHALFTTLRSRRTAAGAVTPPWTQWPEALRDHTSPAVRAFARQHAAGVEFQIFLQWLARTQWDETVALASSTGMELGLITDLAVGAAADGAESWHWPALTALGAELGAPPDAFAPAGQSWGVPPWRPGMLAEQTFAPFRALLDANMHGAGAVRIDHVLGLQRQFWVPRGLGAGAGAYVRYPREALLEQLAEASHRHRCAVIGEDLGNVPRGLRDYLATAGVFGNRVVYFERNGDGRFIPPEQYAPLSVASVGTHDLPTLRGFLAGVDIDEREARGLYAHPDQALVARHAHQTMRKALAEALVPYGANADPESWFEATHRFLAACASRLVAVRIEDVFDMLRQPNLPGMGDEAPNWRQRLPGTVDALTHLPRWQRLAGILAARSRR